jgi:hypothetical protein
MNPEWFGDSYDIVKKFFIHTLQGMDYEVYIDPMFTGDWDGKKEDFIKFIGDKLHNDSGKPVVKSALFVDPDTGIKEKVSPKHITFKAIRQRLERYEIVFSFDQSFSRSISSEERMQEKLSILKKLDVNGLYYNSHTKFLFASKKVTVIDAIREELLKKGLPNTRIITNKSI